MWAVTVLWWPSQEAMSEVSTPACSAIAAVCIRGVRGDALGADGWQLGAAAVECLAKTR